MRNFIKAHLPTLVIVLTVGIMFVMNYRFGTFLSGWDNLQTELDPALAVKRAFFAVWEEYQSFGLLGGMGHGADFLRALFLWIISFFVPQTVIRYGFHFLMLLLGGLGAKKLFEFTLGGAKHRLIPLFGALFYLLNFGTLQIFHVPFEPFSIFFAFLPWQVWIFLSTVKQGSKKNYGLFLLINLLATPSAYVQTLFAVYLLILVCISTGILLQNSSRLLFKRLLLLSSLILLINAFWILPQVYFLKTSNRLVSEAKINQIATEDTYFQNKEKSNWPSFLKMEGFYSGLVDIERKPLFQDWKTHFDNPIVGFLPYLFGAIFLLGIAKKSRYRAAFIFTSVLVAVGLLSAVSPFQEINDLIRKNSMINQIFRSPFTKFIIPYSLVAGYFFAAGLSIIVASFHPFRNRRAGDLLLFLIFSSLILFSFPSFRGYFFSPGMEISVPQDYLKLMDYFKKIDKNKRIALLPDYTFWGWFFHRWGYDGSGFLWYGIEQPIVSRTFDVWSNKSEGYFWEIKAAIEEESLEKFEKVIEKYNIDYLLVDYTLLPVIANFRALQYERLNDLLAKSRKLNLVRESDNLFLYRVNHDKNVQNFVSVSTPPPNIGPSIRVTNEDRAYLDIGDYQTSGIEQNRYYPFSDLLTQTRLKEKKWEIEETSDRFIFKAKVPFDMSRYLLVGHNVSENISLYKDGIMLNESIPLDYEVDKNTLSVSFPKKEVHSFDMAKTSLHNCGKKGKNELKSEKTKIIVTSGDGAIGCFGYDAPYLDQRYGYLISTDVNSIEGRYPFFYILDKTKNQSHTEDRLSEKRQLFLVGPKYQYGLGYSFVFNNNSYEGIPAKNELTGLNIYLLPYKELKEIVFEKKNASILKQAYFTDFKVDKLHYFLYQARIPQQNRSDRFLTLYQSFHPGWKAYQMNSQFPISNFQFINTYLPFLFGKEMKDHVLVNNWANGWNLASKKSNKIVIIFWPQYLEFVGFGLLIATLVSFFVFFKKNGKTELS